MLKYIEQKILQINKATGIEIIFMPDDTLLINTFTNSTRKHSVIKESSFIAIKDLKKLAEKLDKSVPLSVVLNGKGVLTRMLSPSQKTGNLVSIVLPGSNPSDFYYQLFENSHFTQISIVRKELADKIVEQLRDAGFRILSVSPGFSSLSYIVPFLKHDESKQAKGSSFVIHFNGGTEILDLKTNDGSSEDGFAAEYQVADQYIKGQELLSYAASVSLMTDDLKLAPAIPSEIVTKQREDYRYYKLFRTSGIALLITVFVILLTSFLFYSHYYSLNKEMQFSSPAGSRQNEQLLSLQKESNKKEKFLEKSGWTSAARTSYFADRIGSVTPADVLLTNMTIYPAKNNAAGESNSLAFKKDTILVSGNCPDPVMVNQFMNGLKIISDFREVAVRNYQYRKEKETGIFLIEIITR